MGVRVLPLNKGINEGRVVVITHEWWEQLPQLR